MFRRNGVTCQPLQCHESKTFENSNPIEWLRFQGRLSDCLQKKPIFLIVLCSINQSSHSHSIVHRKPTFWTIFGQNQNCRSWQINASAHKSNGILVTYVACLFDFPKECWCDVYLLNESTYTWAKCALASIPWQYTSKRQFFSVLYNILKTTFTVLGTRTIVVLYKEPRVERDIILFGELWFQGIVDLIKLSFPGSVIFRRFDVF